MRVPGVQEHSLEGKTWALLALALPNTCPGREGAPRKTPAGPVKLESWLGPLMPVSKGISEESGLREV